MTKDDAKSVRKNDTLRSSDEEERDPWASDQFTATMAPHFTPDNIVPIAESQFPRLEAQVRMHREMERTRRVLIAVAGICLIAGAGLLVFAPNGKEGVSYAVAAILAVLPLGAIGIQEFRIRSVGVVIEGSAKSVEASVPAKRTAKRER